MFSRGNQSHPDLPGAVPSPPPPSHSAPSLLGGQAYRHQGNTEISKRSVSYVRTLLTTTQILTTLIGIS